MLKTSHIQIEFIVIAINIITYIIKPSHSYAVRIGPIIARFGSLMGFEMSFAVFLNF